MMINARKNEHKKQSRVLTIIAKVKVAGEDPWNVVQAVIAIVLVVLAVDLAFTALKTIGKESKA